MLRWRYQALYKIESHLPSTISLAGLVLNWKDCIDDDSVKEQEAKLSLG